MKIELEQHKLLLSTLGELRIDRQPYWSLWRDLANYFLPKRYVWLQSAKEQRVREARNPFILDSTGTSAARILASGMMNGITSPSRPWFRLRVPGYDDDGGPIAQWADEVSRRMMVVMSESNFYNSMAVLYLDLVIFGSAANLIYEDEDDIIRCYNPALGEFYLGQSHRLSVDTFAREFMQTPKQLCSRFGEENLSETSRNAYKRGGANALKPVTVAHLIEPNTGESSVPKKFAYRETYWELGAPAGTALSQRGFNELPGVFPRWELTANDSYGTSPAMDALGDVIQLQLETKRKAQGLDKMINPPIVADIQLQHRPTALMPNGITYIAGSNSVGVKPLYEIRAPIQEMTADIRDIQTRIRETLHNDLFNMISQLDTVRSAAEIDARREEKLVLLGSVLERFENEALDPAINRIFSIMQRSNLLPDAPEEIQDAEIQVQYVSILSTAQRALAVAPMERWMQIIAQVSSLNQDALLIPKWDEMLRDYGQAVGVDAKNINTLEEIDAQKQQKAQAEQAAQMAQAAPGLAQGAKNLSETDVGGGANALQQLLAQG